LLDQLLLLVGGTLHRPRHRGPGGQEEQLPFYTEAGLRPLFVLVAMLAWLLPAMPAGQAANPPNQQQQPSAAGDLQKQEQQLRDALKANPDDAATHLKLARILLDRRKFPAAADQARAARKDPKLSDEADGVLALALFLARDQRALFLDVKPGQREPHAESLVRMSLGLAYMNPVEIDKAGPLLRDAVQLDPKAYRPRIAYARFLLLKRRMPEAHQQMDAARALAPDEAGVIRIGAELDRAEGKTDAAIAGFTKVLQQDQVSLPALAGRADALIHQDKLDEAQQDVSAGLRLARNSQLQFLQALILARQGRIKDADQVLARLSSTFWRSNIGYYLQAVVKSQLGEPETAYYYLSKFNGVQPSVTAATSLMAEMALQRKDPSIAIRLLQPVVEANPADQESVTRLARAYVSNGQPERVIPFYQRVAAAPVLAVPPKADAASLMMMYGDAVDDLVEVEKVAMAKTPEAVMPTIALREGDLDKAAALAEPLAAKNPDDPALQNLLGSVRLAQKQWPEAEAIFRGIVAKHPDFVPAAFNLVEALVAGGKLDEAQSRLTELTQRANG
jgi:predicted Zn-dependent protease